MPATPGSNRRRSTARRSPASRKLAVEWWDERGPFRRSTASTRSGSLISATSSAGGSGATRRRPASLSGLSVLDIGCGGGLVCEPLARLGAERDRHRPCGGEHRGCQGPCRRPRASTLPIEGTTAEELAARGQELRCRAAARSGGARARRAGIPQGGGAAGQAWRRDDPLHAQPHAEGLSRSPSSAPSIILRWLPVGTHQWQRFVTPEELASALCAAGLASPA